MSIEDIIQEQIALQNGSISFANYMELALYHPKYGYYTSKHPKFGKNGDFITAPELGQLFAKCLAKESINIFNHLKNGSNSILEIGAGTGKLAADLIEEINKQNIPLESYLILEKSPQLKKIQQKTLSRFMPGPTKIIWLKKLPAPNSFTGIILANEVLDALAVTCFSIVQDKKQTIYERRVAYNIDNNKFYFVNAAAGPVLLSAITRTNLLKQLSEFSHDNFIYNSEINLELESFIKHLSSILVKGVIILCDYGFLRHEYYHAIRNGGTIMTHYKHTTHPDPFLLPGLKDITAHVDFSLVQDLATAQHLNCLALTTLTWFLLNCGITELLFKNNEQISSVDKIKLQTELHTLTSPTEMGEIFKVLYLGRNYHEPLLGAGKLS